MAVLETSLMVSQSINIINILTYKNKTFFTHPSLTLIFEYFTESFPKKKNVEGGYKLSRLPYILPGIAPTVNFYLKMSK